MIEEFDISEIKGKVEEVDLSDIQGLSLDPTAKGGAGVLERAKASYSPKGRLGYWQAELGPENVTEDDDGNVFINRGDGFKPVDPTAPGVTGFQLSDLPGDIADYAAQAPRDIIASLTAGATAIPLIASGAGIPAVLPAVAAAGGAGSAAGDVISQGIGDIIGVDQGTTGERLRSIGESALVGAVAEPVGLVLGEVGEKIVKGGVKTAVHGVGMPNSIPLVGGRQLGIKPFMEELYKLVERVGTTINPDVIDDLLSTQGQTILDIFESGGKEISKNTRAAAKELAEVPAALSRNLSRDFRAKLSDAGIDQSGEIDTDLLSSVFDDWYEGLELANQNRKIPLDAKRDRDYIDTTLREEIGDITTIEGLRNTRRNIESVVKANHGEFNARTRAAWASLKHKMTEVMEAAGEAQVAGGGQVLRDADIMYSEGKAQIKEATKQYGDINKATKFVRNYINPAKGQQKLDIEDFIEEPEFGGLYPRMRVAAGAEKLQGKRGHALPTPRATEAAGTKVGADMDKLGIVGQIATYLQSTPEQASKRIVDVGKVGRAVEQIAFEQLPKIGKVLETKMPSKAPIVGGQSLGQIGTRAAASDFLRSVGETPPPPDAQSIVAKAYDIGRNNYGANRQRYLDAGNSEEQASLSAFLGMAPKKVDAAIRDKYAAEVKAFKLSGAADGVDEIKKILQVK